MSILGKLALLFVIVPLIELVLLVQMGRWVGLAPTLGLVILTGVVGAWLARHEGMRTIWSFRTKVEHGSIPSGALMDGLCILVGGALLLTPGLLTDVLGFSLLVPPTRRWIQSRIRKRLEKSLADGTLSVSQIHFDAGFSGATAWRGASHFGDADPVRVVDPEIVEAEIVEVEESDSRTDPDRLSETL